MNKAYLDTETGGFESKTDALLQIALVPVIDGERLPHFSSYMMPPSDLIINDSALKVNGIKRIDIPSFKPEKDVLVDFCSYLEKLETKLTFTAFNAPFDLGFVKQWFLRNKMQSDFGYFFRPMICDVLKKAQDKKRYFPVRPENMKLTTLSALFKIKHDGAHEALSDVLAMIDLDNILDSLGEQITPESKLSYRENCKKYLDSKYIIFNPDGDIFIQKNAVKDQNALRFILNEMWEMYGQ